jgi:hypothetical protein
MVLLLMPLRDVLENVLNYFLGRLKYESLFLNFFFLDRWQRSQGMALRKNIKDEISPEIVRDNWEKICDFSNDPMYPESAQEITLHFARELYELAEKSGNDSNS